MKENLPKAKVEKMLIAKKKWKIFRKKCHTKQDGQRG